MPEITEKDIPYFIEIRGCINCEASEHHKRITGHDYGFDHESMSSCIMFNCGHYTFRDRQISVDNPFYDPEEIVRFAKKDGTKIVIENSIKLCQSINETFGEFYNMKDVSIDELIEELNSELHK
ncbi:MAG: hypothetical protein KAJ20_03545 [Candidatus Aenigmarchaeota archaeon]|nr:hypothetical protein [Candidatus Aenigmarchaeota archaeon]MCK5373386.1 hypothetical protein [Candidatus Aenigmarchaeota archaeon]